MFISFTIFKIFIILCSGIEEQITIGENTIDVAICKIRIITIYRGFLL